VDLSLTAGGSPIVPDSAAQTSRNRGVINRRLQENCSDLLDLASIALEMSATYTNAEGECNSNGGSTTKSRPLSPEPSKAAQ